MICIFDFVVVIGWIEPSQHYELCSNKNPPFFEEAGFSDAACHA
jgi:hypothetical protein